MRFDIRRFLFNDIDPLKVQLDKKNIIFEQEKKSVSFDNRLPYKNDFIEELSEELPF